MATGYSIPKFLRLNAQEVGVLVKVFGSLRLSNIPQDQHRDLFTLRDRLGRYYIATAEELNEDHEGRGTSRKVRVTARVVEVNSPLLPDDIDGALATLRGSKAISKSCF